MLILTIRTDNQVAEIGLYNDQQQVVYQSWQAHRDLADTINLKIVDVLMAGDTRLHQLGGIVVFKGPGSFTGLRIGMTIANALAYSLAIPVVSELGDEWLQQGIDRLIKNENEKVATPEYGALPNITTPKR